MSAFDQDHRSLVIASIVLGMGLGGFLDGIVLHQLLQLHNMLSAVRPRDTAVELEVQMFWDGVFHLGCWSLTVVGVVMLYRAVQPTRSMPSGRALAGGLLIGWGIFNFVEGIVDHYLLGVHHVVERLGLSPWDHLFVASGPLLAAIGAALVRSTGSEREPPAWEGLGRPEPSRR